MELEPSSDEGPRLRTLALLRVPPGRRGVEVERDCVLRLGTEGVDAKEGLALERRCDLESLERTLFLGMSDAGLTSAVITPVSGSNG